MLLCATTTMKILDILFKLSYENTWLVGFKVGFVAWLILSFVLFIAKINESQIGLSLNAHHKELRMPIVRSLRWAFL